MNSVHATSPSTPTVTNYFLETSFWILYKEHLSVSLRVKNYSVCMNHIKNVCFFLFLAIRFNVMMQKSNLPPYVLVHLFPNHIYHHI